ncbi:MAG TPA: DNA primase [candidate division Zixibacteria bacterium]|nr:DNA primase [candidate division Zixibacteria bacterium]
MIPQETIDQIRQATDIVQIIGEYLRLKKRGRNYQALCPFHTEKTPSFNVSPDKQIFHCFGCGKGGNVYTFLMEHENMSFVEAVRHLARKANITIREERTSPERREQIERLNYANEVALEYFRKTLRLSQYSQVYNDYLIGRRGLNEESINNFMLGLAGQEWDGLLRYATRKDLSAEDLSKAGLTILSEKKGNYFDRFRQRLMIPIINLSQHPIAFGGRTLKKGEPAKYVNSPETPLYNKSNVLYGLNFARDHIRNTNTAYVVEGYFDVISLWQVGIRNVVASSGTAFTSQQARLLARFAEDVYLFFDADSAGQKAAIRSVDSLYDAGLEVKVIVAPAGEDPDSLARTKGADVIHELTENALGFIPFRIREIDTGGLGIIAKEKLIKEFAALSDKIADATRRGLFQEEAANALNVDVALLRQSVATTPADFETSPPQPRYKSHPDEFELLSLLFSGAGDIDMVFEKISPEDFDSKQLARLYAAMINEYRTTGIVDAAALSESVRDPEFLSLITEVASRHWPPEEVDAAVVMVVKAISQNKRKRIRNRLKQELDEATAAGDDKKAERLLKEINDLL